MLIIAAVKRARQGLGYHASMIHVEQDKHDTVRN